jgi:hypothetical protein
VNTPVESDNNAFKLLPKVELVEAFVIAAFRNVKFASPFIVVVMDCPEGGAILIGYATGSALLQAINPAIKPAETIDCFNILSSLKFIIIFLRG